MNIVLAPEHDCILAGGIVGSGNLNADIMFVGIAPGRTEMETHRVLSGPSGKFLDAILKFEFVGLRREDVFCTNLCCFWQDKPSKQEIAACYPRLLEEIRNVKPKIIVCLGAIATTALMPFAGKFGNAQGGVWRDKVPGTNYECWFLSTYHPAAYKPVRKDGMEAITAIRDLRKIKNILAWPLDIAHVDYTVAPSVEHANAWLEHFVTDHVDDVVALDVETLYSHKEMISIAFSCSCGTYHIPRALMPLVDFKVLECTLCRWTFHNGMFDTEMMRLLLHVNLPIREDTMLMSYSLDERGGKDMEADSGGFRRSVGIHGLKRLSREFFAAGYYDAKTTVVKNKRVATEIASANPERNEAETDAVADVQTPIELLTPEELAEYNSKDAAYTYRLQKLFEPRQIADNVRQFYLERLIPGANMLSEIHERGAHLDIHQLGELADDWCPEWLRLLDELNDLSIELGWPYDTEGQLNPDAWPSMHKFVYDIVGMPVVPGQGRTTKREVLEEWTKLDTKFGQFCRTLLAFRGRNKDINTWIIPLGEQHDANDFIHPEPLIHGTSVGRMSYHVPPVQTTGKPRTVGVERARIRKIFSAADGNILIEADFSQSELWWAGMLSNDTAMLDDLRRCVKCDNIFDPIYPTICPTDEEPHKADFHRRLAISSFGVDPDSLDPTTWDRYRNSAKVFAFGGLLYGGGIDVITGKHYLGKAQPNLYFVSDIKKAAEIYKNATHKYFRYCIEWRNEEKRHVQTEGDQQSASGRKRRYYYITDFKQFNQTINFPVSCVSHDNLFDSMLELHPALKPLGGYLWWEVHDSIVAEAPKDKLHEVVQLMKDIMQKPRYGAPFGVPIEVKVGANWGDLHDYKPEEDYMKVIA